jgi:hypothetical protein
VKPISLIREYKARGVRFELTAEGDVIVDEPRGELLSQEIEELRSIKDIILETLRHPSEAGLVSTMYRSPCISSEVAAEIQRIEAEAYRLGWTRERLWNAHFWPHTREQPRGLVSLMELGDRLIGMTPDHILIAKPNGRSRQRFWRNDA